MRFARSLVLSLCAIAVASCGPTDENGDGIADGIRSPDSVTAVAPSTPIGSLSGQVMDTRFGPLADANIAINVGGLTGADDVPFTTTTNEAGFYSIRGLPAGAQVLVTITKAGYGTARSTVTIPSAAGNFPINNGNASVNPILLTNLNGSLKFLVVSSSGRPARQARATLEVFPAFTEVPNFETGYGASRGSVVVDAEADDTGTLTFTNIPGIEEASRLRGDFVLHVSSYDENGDGVIDSNGTVRYFSANALLVDGSTRAIVLPNARDPSAFRVLATNVPSLTAFPGPNSPPGDNMLKPSDQIHITFNHAIESTSVVARLADETGTVLLGSSATIGTTGTTLTIQPSQGLSIGAKYHLSVRVTSLDSGAALNLNGFIFGGDLSQAKPFAVGTITYKDVGGSGTLNDGETVTVVFNQPIGGYGFAPPGDPPLLYLHFNADLNADGQIGFNGPGEFGAPTSPFVIFPQEPPPGAITNMGSPPTPVPAPKVVDTKNSGYSTTYAGVMSGLPLAGVSTGTPVRVAFTRNTTVGRGFQTTWSKQITEDVTASLATAPLP